MKRIVLALIALCVILQAPAVTAQDSLSGSGTVAEAIDVDNYIYLRLEDPEVWVASGRVEVAVGDRVSYQNALAMKEFHSKTLDRTFETILFVGAVSIEGRDMAGMHPGAMPKMGVSNMGSSGAETVPTPTPGEIKSLEGGKTVAEIYAGSTALEGKSVSLRARVIKVNEDILGKNWITLQDGTGSDPDNNLRATSAELPSPGDVVIASGTVRNNVDIGSGYKYKVLLEEATFSK